VWPGRAGDTRRRPEQKGCTVTKTIAALADTEWRLAPIPGVEYGIFAIAPIEFADKFNDQPAELRPGLIEATSISPTTAASTSSASRESRLNHQLLKAARRAKLVRSIEGEVLALSIR